MVGGNDHIEMRVTSRGINVIDGSLDLVEHDTARVSVSGRQARPRRCCVHIIITRVSFTFILELRKWHLNGAWATRSTAESGGL